MSAGGVRRDRAWLEQNCVCIDGVWMTRNDAKAKGLTPTPHNPPPQPSKPLPAKPGEPFSGPVKTPLDKLNKLERGFYDFLVTKPDRFASVEIQAFTFRIGTDCRYTPDFSALMNTGNGPELCFFEVKGPHFWEDAKVKLKVAAAKFPYLKFYLCRRPKGEYGFTCDQVQP